MTAHYKLPKAEQTRMNHVMDVSPICHTIVLKILSIRIHLFVITYTRKYCIEDTLSESYSPLCYRIYQEMCQRYCPRMHPKMIPL